MSVIEYKSRFKEYFLLKMSQYRRTAQRKIQAYMTPLLVHLMACEYFGKSHKDYNWLFKEVKHLKSIILKANQKKKTNKEWFSKEFIIEISEDEMASAKYEFFKKYKDDDIKDYESILDFTWFDLFD